MKPNVNLTFVPSLLVVCTCVGVCRTPQTLELLVVYRVTLSALIVAFHILGTPEDTVRVP